jgi:hypothetical protein
MQRHFGKIKSKLKMMLIRSKQVTLIALALLGVYVNIVAFGFEYGKGNHDFALAMVNWLKNPSLYPDDPITEGFARFPTFFWPVVAYASTWADTQLVLFVAFIFTKVLFFWALTRLVAGAVQDYRLIACIVCAVALSPVLNSGTPLSDSDVLNSVQTHTSLAIAILLWVGCFLVEGRWANAALLLGCATYINGLFVIFVLFAFTGFVLLDWKQHKREILFALLLLGVVVLPCIALSRGAFPSSIPEDYVKVILMRYPFHFTLRSHSADQLWHGLAQMFVPACMILFAGRLGLSRYRRLEWLLGFFVLPFLLGVLVGEVFPLPTLIRLHLLRSESFLLMYSMILVPIYGARILLSSEIRSPVTTWLVGVPAALWAFDGFALPVLLLTGIVLALDPNAHFERVCRHGAQSWMARTAAVVLILAGFIIEVRRVGGLSSPGLIAALVAVAGAFCAYGTNLATGHVRQSKFAVTACALVIVVATIGSIPSSARLWNPVVVPGPSEAAWREVQQWAKANTPKDTKFLTPPVPSGFRVFSERVSWVEWKDGNISFNFPPYADEWLRRMSAIGIHPPMRSAQSMQNDYKEQSWDHLLGVARQEKINYIVQFKTIPYGIAPVFANERFAVYRVFN